MGQTVNLLSSTSVVRIHLPPPAQKFPFPLRFPPEGRKAPPDGEFLRFHLRTALLGSQVIFFAGDKRRGMGVGYKKLGGDIKIAYLFERVKREFTRIL